MVEIKKIALKGLLLLIALTALNYIYETTLWQNDLEEYSGVSKRISDAKNADILYLGDCSDAYFGFENDHEKGISQLLDSLLPHKNVATISETGFHAGMFAGILDNLPQHTNIKTVVVTMNLRSFSANVLYAFTANATQQRTTMLNNSNPALLNRFLLTFKPTKAYKGVKLKAMRTKQQQKDEIPLTPFNSLYDWKAAFKNGDYINFDNSWTLLKKEKAMGHITNYAFQIDTQKNPRIADFDKIVNIVKQKNIKLIFHLLPENTTTTKQLIGEDLTNLINYNRNLLHQRYGSENVTIIDNMDLLNGTEFIEDLPNSHFYYNGRKLMAKEIAKFIE